MAARQGLAAHKAAHGQAKTIPTGSLGDNGKENSLGPRRLTKTKRFSLRGGVQLQALQSVPGAGSGAALQAMRPRNPLQPLQHELTQGQTRALPRLQAHAPLQPQGLYHRPVLGSSNRSAAGTCVRDNGHGIDVCSTATAGTTGNSGVLSDDDDYDVVASGDAAFVSPLPVRASARRSVQENAIGSGGGSTPSSTERLLPRTLVACDHQGDITFI